MGREQILELLRAHEQELKQAGIVHLQLFGSRARGDQRRDSDVDLLAVFDEGRRLSALEVVGLELKLSDLLGFPVELSEEGSLKPRVKLRVEVEALRAF